MTTFGVTATGFVLPTQQELLEIIRADQRADIHPLIDVADESPLGQLNGIITRQLAIVWEGIQAAYKSNDPDAAEGDALTSIGKLTGTERRAATYSTVTVECDLDSGTALVSGTHFVSLDGNPSVRFTPIADYTAPADQVAALPFRAENTGPISAPSGTLTVIATPVTGWNSANNPLDAVLGRVADDDATLRTRREEELTAAGSSTTFAIASDLLQLGATSAIVFENTTDTTDANGLPPHSFEALIWDGDPAELDDDDVAQTIWDSKPAGIQTFGSNSGDARDRNPSTGLADGPVHLVPFSRVTQKPVFLEYELLTDGTYAGDAAVQTAVATFANGYFATIGKDVTLAALFSVPILSVPGVTNVLSLKLGFSASPTDSNDLVIGARELARFDSSDITIV